MKYTVRSPLLDSIDRRARFHKSRLLFFLIVPAFAAGLFFGYGAGMKEGEVVTYNAGYGAAMNHVRVTIEEKMPGLVPFYMADLGIKFIPRGVNIVGIKYVGVSATTDDDLVASAR